jgi:hypothetical protein
MKSLKKIKSFSMRGKRFKLEVKELANARGRTEPPGTKNRKVYIDSREKGKELLATLIDELIHCAVWDLENDAVDEISDDMANVLWRAGLRFVDEAQENSK